MNFAARSETGNVRTDNEDNLFCNGLYKTSDSLNESFFINGVCQAPSVFAVCDGMGGEDCGEIASLTAIETLSEHFDLIRDSIPDENFAVNDYVSDTSRRLNIIMKDQRIRTGTTLALAAVNYESFRAYNLGDSRVYRLSQGNLIQVTDDHTLAADKVRLGMMTPAKAARSRERNILTRCLGIYTDPMSITPDSNGPFYLNENQGILICSDGLTDMLTHKELTEIVKGYSTPSDIVNALTNKALANGGLDNVTCIFIDL